MKKVLDSKSKVPYAGSETKDHMFIFARAYDLIVASLWWAHRYNALELARDAAFDAAVKDRGLDAVTYRRIDRHTGEFKRHIDFSAFDFYPTRDERDDHCREIGDGAAFLSRRAVSCKRKLVSPRLYIAAHLSPAYDDGSAYVGARRAFWG